MSDFGARVGQLILKKREELGLSYAEAAVRVYGDDGQGGESKKRDLQRLEQGASKKPTARTLKKLRDGLGITQADIDACRTPEELELARFASQLFDVIQGAATKLGISEDLTVELTERHAEGNPADFGGALAELERAVEQAAGIGAHRPGNTSDDVETEMARVQALNDAGEIDAAEDALWEELDRAEAAQIALIDRGLEQVVLTRNVDRTAALELKKLALEGGGFEDLRLVQDTWYERGRDMGLRFDLEVSITLARASVDRATDPDETGAALIDLGNALQILGERETSTGRLREAVTAYQAALTEWTKDRVPLDWAMTQNNLGSALQKLGARETGTNRLEQAVVAYRAALIERTQDRVPLQWAATQNNLGCVLAALGQRETGTVRLEQAIVAFDAALTERTQDRVPLDWAMTQSNLGIAIQTLGERESGTDRLEQAVDTFRAALTEWTQDRVPLDWARTQNNLGNALQSLGERETGTDRLKQAVDAYRAALTEHTQDRVPLDWAMTQNNLGNALSALGQREAGTDRLEQAVTACRAALTELTQDRVPMQWAATQHNLAEVYLAFFDETGDAAHLDTAQTHLDAARAVYEEAQASHYLAVVEKQQTDITTRRASLD